MILHDIVVASFFQFLLIIKVYQATENQLSTQFW